LNNPNFSTSEPPDVFVYMCDKAAQQAPSR
jgi:hypothetical protein